MGIRKKPTVKAENRGREAVERGSPSRSSFPAGAQVKSFEAGLPRRGCGSESRGPVAAVPLSPAVQGSRNRFENIRAITFDVAGTLIEPWPSVGEIYAEAAHRFGWRELDPAKLNASFAAAWRTKGPFDYSRVAWAQLVGKTFGRRLPAALFTSIYERFKQPDAWKIYDDVLPALEHLQRTGFLLGVVSNWDERLRPLLRTLKLDSCFQAMAISAEVGFQKPDRRIFEAMRKVLQVEPGFLLHVGDGEEEDVQAAGEAGWQALRIDRSGPPAPDRLRNLWDLISLLPGDSVR